LLDESEEIRVGTEREALEIDLLNRYEGGHGLTTVGDHKRFVMRSLGVFRKGTGRLGHFDGLHRGNSPW